jgi:hypothetical protein
MMKNVAIYSCAIVRGAKDCENPFIVVAREVGDNHLHARQIRNSISLTRARSHRIICASN